MNLHQKTLQLLQEKCNCVVVKILSSKDPEYPLGTVLVVTSKESWGNYPLIQEKLIQYARISLKDKKSHIAMLENNTLQVYFDVLTAPDQLFIIGAGHIAMALCKMATQVGFQVSVLDDRPEFVSKERFPEATHRLAGDFVSTLKGITFSKDTYLVLVTRGHVHDRDCLRIVLQYDLAYIGMICSLRRRATTYQLLEQEGYSKEQLNRIFAPIGLPIGGETPEEISLGIMAEILAVKNQGNEWVWNLKNGSWMKR
ncbi:MAG TPA: XdhC family protein [Planctomycetota bacterium]|nr:XdhC family protein [Planctomycetota bacterium]HRU50573.1 XdhC family protein [Planctomycetota bacterium]